MSQHLKQIINVRKRLCCRDTIIYDVLATSQVGYITWTRKQLFLTEARQNSRLHWILTPCRPSTPAPGLYAMLCVIDSSNRLARRHRRDKTSASNWTSFWWKESVLLRLSSLLHQFVRLQCIWSRWIFRYTIRFLSVNQHFCDWLHDWVMSSCRV